MYETFEHTADVGLRIRAADLPELFAEAGRALFSIMVDNYEVVQPDETISLDVPAAGVEDLLFDWISELIFTFEMRHLLLCRFDVTLDDQAGLHADAAGQMLDEQRHRIGFEVKAVTYHELKVRETDDGYMAEVIVDI